MPTASEGGARGMAILASFMAVTNANLELSDYLSTMVFDDAQKQTIQPNKVDVDGLTLFMKRYTNGLAIEQSAVDHII